jgi:pyroglutamyl-peptidase
MIKKSNIPAMLCYSAGTFCCNELFYGVSHYIRKNNLKILNGFIHITFIYEQTMDSPRPSLPLSTIIEDTSIAIDVITKRV